MRRPYCVANHGDLSRQQGPPSIADRSVEVNAISGRKTMSEGAVHSHTAQPPGRNQPDRRLSEGIIDNPVLYQDECVPVERCAATLASRALCITSSRSATRAAMPC